MIIYEHFSVMKLSFYLLDTYAMFDKFSSDFI